VRFSFKICVADKTDFVFALQYEFVLAHLPPLEAVDGLVAAREAIVNVAA